jgi:dTDP-4-amino-4,6-dideoxygalactose transaminase
MKNRIPFVDLKAQYASIREEIQEAINRTLEESAFIMGKPVSDFETAFAAYCRVPYAVGCSSGTTAIHLALMGCGVGRGDGVVTVPNTFIATAEGISHSGARPFFVEVDERTCNLSPDRLVEFLERECRPDPKTGRPVHRGTGAVIRAVIPVHLYGRPADMDPILEISKRHGLRVIEDAAQAHGANYKGRRAGNLGDVACFSFFPGKNLGAYGDAGAVVSADQEVADRVRLLSNHGRKDKYEHLIEGYNYRIDALQARILSVKLRHLDDWTRRRRENAARYSELLRDWDGILPATDEGVESAFHLYVIRTRNRKELIGRLTDSGIAHGIHYPIPLHLQKAYTPLGYKKGDFPVTEKLAEEILSLPMYPELIEQQIRDVAEVVLQQR